MSKGTFTCGILPPFSLPFTGLLRGQGGEEVCSPEHGTGAYLEALAAVVVHASDSQYPRLKSKCFYASWGFLVGLHCANESS